MKEKLLSRLLIVLAIVGSIAEADISVDIAESGLTVTSTLQGTVMAKVVSPDGNVIVNKTYEGNTFSWSPSGIDGAYTYQVRVIAVQNTENTEKSHNGITDYTGGTVEIVEGQIVVANQEGA